jgi:DNA-binding response OmpR family regulator
MVGRLHAGAGFPDHEALERIRVLVADDNRDIVETYAFMLRQAGFDVMTASDGRDALDCFQRFHPQVALLDIGLPGLDGFEVARRVRDDLSLQTVALIAITAYGTDDDSQTAIAVGFDHFLVKPVLFSELVSLIRASAPVCN